MRQFSQQLVIGATLGATYGLIALGYTMVYGIIQLINFAHGEVFMVGAFAGLAAFAYVLPEATPAVVAVAVMLALAMAVAVATGLLMERFAYRPLRNAPRLAPLITAIGVSIFLQEAVRLFYPDAKKPKAFPKLISGEVVVSDVVIPRVSLFVLFAAVALMAALQWFVLKSKTGRAMRATAQDRDAARLMGIDIDRIIVITFALGAALAGVAGVLHGLRFNQISFSIGFIAGLKAFTAAVLGGIGNIAGAVYGGFILGIVESMATQYLPQGSSYKDMWAFIVLILLLVFRPTGLLGERVATRS